jgi:hypothetical protein
VAHRLRKVIAVGLFVAHTTFATTHLGFEAANFVLRTKILFLLPTDFCTAPRILITSSHHTSLDFRDHLIESCLLYSFENALPTARMQEPDWHGMLAEFLQRDSTTPIRRDALRRILEMVPEQEPTKHLLPVDEAEIKLKLLWKLKRYWEVHYPELTGEPRDRYKPLHPIVIATVMMIDVKMAQNLMLPGMAGEYVMNGFLRDLKVMPCFIKRGNYPSQHLVLLIS